MEEDVVFLGTEIKLNIHIDPLGDLSMSDYNFKVDVYCHSKKYISIDKKNSIRVDNNNYIILIDTEKIGIGTLKCKVTAYIPDKDFSDSYRTEVMVINTGINIIKSY